jgi:hypothetical protein
MSAADGLPQLQLAARMHRAVPSRYPPIQAFEDVADPADLPAVLELEGWTNDRLVAERLIRLAPEDRIVGRPNASVIMAAFLHGSPLGRRFTSHLLGAWYAADEPLTGLIEVANGLRHEIAQSALTEKTEDYRFYTARLAGPFVDIRGTRPDLHDPESHAASQPFGEEIRATALSGICYDSVRRPGHANAVAYRPSRILDVLQADHYRLTVPQAGKVVALRLPAEAP